MYSGTINHMLGDKQSINRSFFLKTSNSEHTYTYLHILTNIQNIHVYAPSFNPPFLYLSIVGKLHERCYSLHLRT